MTNVKNDSHEIIRGDEKNIAPQISMIDLGEMRVDASDAREGATKVMADVNPLHFVKTKLQVIVGELEISVGDLLNAKEHQVLVLQTNLSEPVSLVLEGHVVARGQLVAVDGNFAIRITELPISLQS